MLVRVTVMLEIDVENVVTIQQYVTFVFAATLFRKEAQYMGLEFHSSKVTFFDYG